MGIENEIKKLGSRESELFDCIPSKKEIVAITKGRDYDIVITQGRGLIFDSWLIEKADETAAYAKRFQKETAVVKSAKIHVSKTEKEIIAAIRTLVPKSVRERYPRPVRDLMVRLAIGRVTLSELRPEYDLDVSESHQALLVSVKGFVSADELISGYDELDRRIMRAFTAQKKALPPDDFLKNIAALNVYIKEFPLSGRLVNNSKKAKRLKEFLNKIIKSSD